MATWWDFTGAALKDEDIFICQASGAAYSIVEVTPAHLQQYQIALYNFARHEDNEPATKRKNSSSSSSEAP